MDEKLYQEFNRMKMTKRKSSFLSHKDVLSLKSNINGKMSFSLRHSIVVESNIMKKILSDKSYSIGRKNVNDLNIKQNTESDKVNRMIENKNTLKLLIDVPAPSQMINRLSCVKALNNTKGFLMHIMDNYEVVNTQENIDKMNKSLEKRKEWSNNNIPIILRQINEDNEKKKKILQKLKNRLKDRQQDRNGKKNGENFLMIRQNSKLNELTDSSKNIYEYYPKNNTFLTNSIDQTKSININKDLVNEREGGVAGLKNKKMKKKLLLSDLFINDNSAFRDSNCDNSMKFGNLNYDSKNNLIPILSPKHSTHTDGRSFMSNQFLETTTVLNELKGRVTYAYGSSIISNSLEGTKEPFEFNLNNLGDISTDNKTSKLSNKNKNDDSSRAINKFPLSLKNIKTKPDFDKFKIKFNFKKLSENDVKLKKAEDYINLREKNRVIKNRIINSRCNVQTRSQDHSSINKIRLLNY